MDEPRKAVELYEQALVIAREIGDRSGEGGILGNLANAYRNLGEPRKAIGFCEEALVIARNFGDRVGEGAALFNSALVLDELNDRTQAVARAEAALQILKAIESPTALKVEAQLAAWSSQVK